jgi:hypothetical protein
MTRVVYAGIPITVRAQVLVAYVGVRRPVFHQIGHFGGYALCGSGGEGVPFPHRLARRFARPCLRCWPELRGQAELELKEGVL